MESRDLDLSAFPVLRIDELPRHEESTLHRGLLEGRKLLASLQEENKEESRPMIRYLMKQLDGMVAEITKRNAESRIQQLLSGQSSVDENTSYLMPLTTSSTHSQPDFSTSITPRSAPSIMSTPTPTVKLLPLPSELRRSRSRPGSSGGPSVGNSETHRDSSSSPYISSSRSATHLNKVPDVDTKRKAVDSMPSRQSLAALNSSFGVTFVVGAVEKKKRFLPKPKASVSSEDLRDRERQNRRKVAIQRLLERQTQRKQKNEELRRKKLILRSKQKVASSIVSAPDGADDSSDSESISGGDDSDLDSAAAKEGQLPAIPIADACRDTCPEDATSVALSSGVSVNKPQTPPCVAEKDRTILNGFEILIHEQDPSEETSQPASNHYSETVQTGENVDSFSDNQAVLEFVDSDGDAMAAEEDESLPVDRNTSRAWTDNEELIEKNDRAWDTIRRLRSMSSKKSIQIPTPSREATMFSPETPCGSDCNVSCLPMAPDLPLSHTPAPNEVTSTLLKRPPNSVDLHDPTMANDGIYPSNGQENPVRPVADGIDTGFTEGPTYGQDFVAVDEDAIDSDEGEVDWSLLPNAEAIKTEHIFILKNQQKEETLSKPVLLKDNAKGRRRKDSSQISGDDRKLAPCPYESFDLIFGAAYGSDGSTRFTRKGEAVAVSNIYQCMRAICKLYEEWMEVMEDYATVFSSDSNAEMAAVISDDSPSRAVYKGGTKALHYRVKSSRSEVCTLINDVFSQSFSEWEELPSGLGLGLSWNFLWSWGRPRLNFDHLLVWQKVNHFPESRQLTRKDMLKRNLQSLTEMGKGKKSGEFFEIMPLTFLLPADYKSFVKTFHEIESSKASTGCCNIWIMKPVGMSRGRGISMVTDANTLTYSQTSVLQRYVERPLCLDGYKFDLRLYILVTSFCPLEAFIYKEGFARLSTHKFSMNPKDIDNKFVHLTNSSIQKQNADGPTKDNPLMVGPPSDAGGSKISLLGDHGLWKRLESAGLDSGLIWGRICGLVVKSLVAVDDKMAFQPSCFEVYGYDVLLDQDLRPWLIEVNASPSMAREAYVDVRVKNALIRDTVKLLNPAPFDRAALLKILRRRLKHMSGNLQQPIPSGKSDGDLAEDMRSILGDYTPRKYGEDPEHFGDYQRLCPNTKVFEQAVRLKGKIFNRGSIPPTVNTD